MGKHNCNGSKWECGNNECSYGINALCNYHQATRYESVVSEALVRRFFATKSICGTGRREAISLGLRR